MRSGENWKEYVIADRREFYHGVTRIEFEQEYLDHHPQLLLYINNYVTILSDSFINWFSDIEGV
jgi:hypothetical protein